MRNVPRILIPIIGGIAYSEMRPAYEVTGAAKYWEVIVGTSLLIFESLLHNNNYIYSY